MKLPPLATIVINLYSTKGFYGTKYYYWVFLGSAWVLRESLQHTLSLSYNHFRITASPWIFKCCTFKRRCWPKYLKVSEFSRPRVKPKTSSLEKSRKSWRRRRRKKFSELKTKKTLLFFFSTPNSFSLRQRSQKINASVFIKWSRPKFRKMKISKLLELPYLPYLFPVLKVLFIPDVCWRRPKIHNQTVFEGP